MLRTILAAALALACAAVGQACAHAQSSDAEQLADFVSPQKDARAIALEVEGLKAWLVLNIGFSGRGPDFDERLLHDSFAEAVRSADADYRSALIAALQAADAGRREEALAFFRSADGQQVLANQSQHDDQVRAWLSAPKDKRGAAPPEYIPSEAEKVFATSDTVETLGKAVVEARTKVEQLPTAMERAATIYCAKYACQSGEQEMFRRMYASAHMSSARGEHAMWGKTAADIFPDEKQSALARAACVNDGDEVKKLVASGADPNAVGGEGVMGGGRTYHITPLFWAIDCGAVQGVEALLAAENTNPALLHAMLAHGGDPNAHDRRESALMVAWHQQLPRDGSRVNWDALLAAGADVNLDLGDHIHFDRDVAGKAALHDDWEMVLELLNRGYSRDLGNLAFMVEQADTWPTAARQAAKRQVISILRSHGLLLPFGTMSKNIEPDIGWIDYRARNGILAKAATSSAVMVAESNHTPRVEKPPFNGKYFQLWYLAEGNAFVEATNDTPVLRELTPEEISERWGVRSDQLAAIRESPGTWTSLYLP